MDTPSKKRKRRSATPAVQQAAAISALRTVPRNAGEERWAVGLMAGTSLDGVDAALVQLTGSWERPKVKLLKFATVAYPAALHDRLLYIAGGGLTNAADVSELNFRVGEAFGRAALQVCRNARLKPEHRGKQPSASILKA